MVAVFVCDENGGEIFRCSADAGKARPDLARGESGVHEDTGFVGLNIGAIAGRAATEDGEFDGHEWTLKLLEFWSNFFRKSI